MKKPSNYLPDPALQECIASYGVLEIPEGMQQPYFSPPLALCGFIINLLNRKGRLVSRIDGRDFFTTPAVATGQVTSPVYGEIRGYVKSIMVFFYPLGMFRLFGNNMAELTNASKPLPDFLGRDKAEHLLSALKEKQETEQQVEVLNTFFLERLPHERTTGCMEKVLEFIHENNGNVSVRKGILKKCWGFRQRSTAKFISLKA
ncbi:DUF6597 domain-containing transcriptional factor [Zunongwangia sp. H14]|uniref:DUF6597 domain-containing transcriptional factor n=1 Tax=Zunongwangia sp. H14 TaxID=3240792 RepID=UPI00356A59E2